MKVARVGNLGTRVINDATGFLDAPIGVVLVHCMEHLHDAYWSE